MQAGKSVLGLLGNIVVLLLMSAKLSTLLFCLMPVHLVLTVLYSGRARVLTKAYRAVTAQSSAIAQ